MVLIESDWNLKKDAKLIGVIEALVLIESDWNLKESTPRIKTLTFSVLIESDWNLKAIKKMPFAAYGECINRIRLEFKAVFSMTASVEPSPY